MSLSLNDLWLINVKATSQLYVTNAFLLDAYSSKSHVQAALQRAPQVLACIQEMSPCLTKHSKYMQMQTICNKHIPICVSYKQKLLCTTKNFSQNIISHILNISVMADGYRHFGKWRQYSPKIWYPCTRPRSDITWKTKVLIFTTIKTVS